MKVSHQHYTALQAAIANQPRPTSSDMRARWDALWLAVDTGKVQWNDFKEYNDDHIDTALRQIFRNL